jgi:hypothetical protein
VKNLVIYFSLTFLRREREIGASCTPTSVGGSIRRRRKKLHELLHEENKKKRRRWRKMRILFFFLLLLFYSYDHFSVVKSSNTAK